MASRRGGRGSDRRRALLWPLLGWLLLAGTLAPAVPGGAAPLPWRVAELDLAGGAGADEFAPVGAGALVVWSEARAAGAVLRGRNLLSGAELDVASGRSDAQAVRESKLSPAIDGGLVVWQNRGIDAAGKTFDRIYGRDLAAPDGAHFPIATTRGGQQMPAVSGATVVWADNRRGTWDIFGYDLVGRREFVVAAGAGDQLWPAISGSLVVWADERDGDWDIYGKDLAAGEEFPIATAAGHQTAPAVSGRLVAWQDTRAGLLRYDIYAYDLERKQELAVVTAADYQLRPTVAGDLIIWEDYRNGARDLYAFDRRAGREFAVVTADGVQWQPRLSGNLLLWSDARDGRFATRAARLLKSGLSPAPPDPAFAALRGEADALVAEGAVERTWLWGPAPFQTGQEEYAEAPSGRRLVQYFDKSRMEITDPRARRDGRWFVTNGLLVKELVTGGLQLGDRLVEPLAPADVPMAGDPDDLLGPTYASLAGLLDRPAGTVGRPVVEAIDRAGAVRRITPPADVALAHTVPETRHAVADVFWAYLNAEGPVRRGGGDGPGRLFEPTFFATGLPITEPYWTRVAVGGQPRDVLIQAFERRVLTYTPANPPAWRVEMGNVGRHYHAWRYGS